MATDIRNLLSFHSNDADFRAWGSGIAAQLVACGMVQTADTGQINWTTVTRPAANGLAGYEIYRFNDAQQSAWPVFFKLEYGEAATLGNPQLKLTVGTGSTGAGAITGTAALAARGTTTGAAVDGAGTTRQSIASGDGSRIALLTNVDMAAVARGLGFIIERCRNGAGTVTQPVVVLITTATTGATSWSLAIMHPTAPSSYSAPSVISPDAAMSQPSVSTRVAVAPIPAISDAALHYIRTLVFQNTTIGVGFVTFLCSLFGTSHIWMPLNGAAGSIGSNSGDRVAILWE